MLEFYVDSLITIHFFNYHGGVIISVLMINGQIREKEVRLIANDGEQLGVMSAREAQKLADEAGLDLVKISPKAKPPVCKIIDYGKYKYEMIKRFLMSFFTLFLFLSSFSQEKMTSAQYIDQYHNIAIKQMKEYKIPASIILAEWEAG